MTILLDNTQGAGTLSEDRLTNRVGNGIRISTEYKTSGKWYVEIEAVTLSGHARIDIVTVGATLGTGASTSTKQILLYQSGSTRGRLFNVSGFTSPWFEGDIVGIALDIDNGDFEMFINGVSQGKHPGFLKTHFGDNPINIGIGGGASGSTNIATVNFGATKFKYKIPASYNSYDGSQVGRIIKVSVRKENQISKWFTAEPAHWEEITNPMNGMEDLSLLKRGKMKKRIENNSSYINLKHLKNISKIEAL